MPATSAIVSQTFSMKVFHNHRFTAITEIKNFLSMAPLQQGQNGIDGFVPSGGLLAWEPTNNATDDDKTLFLTFSRGFPVTKDEVMELFTRKYGEGSVVGVMMHENLVYGEQQPLFAKNVEVSHSGDVAVGAVQLVIPGFLHPLFGDLTITPTICRPHYHHQGQNGTAYFVPTGGLWGSEPYNNATEDDKALFLTFSRGFPVTEDEVVELTSMVLRVFMILGILILLNLGFRSL
ncbi:hypothetical protein LINPERHAP2_LOCUS27423 [Linum perenne]